MLVLAQKEGDRILIGRPGQVLTEPIEVSLVEIRGSTARLGFEAPREIQIDRQGRPKTADELMAEAGL